MNKENAIKILKMLDRLNEEIDFMGKAILREKLKPVPVHVKNNNKFRVE